MSVVGGSPLGFDGNVMGSASHENSICERMRVWFRISCIFAFSTYCKLAFLLIFGLSCDTISIQPLFITISDFTLVKVCSVCSLATSSRHLL